MSEILHQTQKLIQHFQTWEQAQKTKEGVPVVHVDEVASKMASFYEKIRGVVEWKEEHLLRRSAIARMLKRRLLLQRNGGDIAEPLVSELIRGGHFPNDQVAQTKVQGVKKVIDKYLFILDNSPSSPKEKEKLQLYDWFLGIAAVEIEEILSPPFREMALIEYMIELMQERIEVVEGIIVKRGMSYQEKETQIQIAVEQALFKLDNPDIAYHLLKKRYPDWASYLSQT